MKKKKIIYYENKYSFGIYCEDGLPFDRIKKVIEKLDGTKSAHGMAQSRS